MKSQAILEWMDPLFPADFLLCSVEIGKVKDHKKLTTLPDFSELLAEEPFAELSLGWNEEGILGCLEVNQSIQASFFPSYIKGDALELFIDTRDNKQAASASSFCHQFIFLPEEVGGVSGQEITRFRGEDAHTLCDPSLLYLERSMSKKGYTLFFRIPKEALHGYDPVEFPRIGFAYRIHRHKGKPSHFPFSSKNFEPLSHPNLWASLMLI